jgi:hypothetical protein
MNENLCEAAPFHVGAVDVVADLVVEEDAPKQVVSRFESWELRVHRAKTLSARSDASPTLIIG